MKLKNVIFDFGQVMVRFDPHYITSQFLSDPADIALVEEVLFDRLYWDRLDDGSIADEELLSSACSRLPQRLWEAARRIYANWYYQLPEIDGMRALVHSLRARGIRVLLLSNISRGFAAHAREIPSLEEFEGCVFSAVVGYTKPHADIFDYICRTYTLAPCETLFVDDNAANLRGAREFGIAGYLFDGNAPALTAYIEELLRA